MNETLNATRRQFYRNHYDKIVGATIERIVLDWDEYGDNPTPILVLRLPNGKSIVAEVWRDTEGNGAGHLAISQESSLPTRKG